MTKFRFDKIVVFFVLLLLSNGCKERIDFDFGTPPTELVVDGFITDKFKRHMVRLSYSTALVDNVLDQRPVSLADVQLIDDLGNTTQLMNLGPGQFFTPQMAASPDRQYKLVVNHLEETYETSFEELPTENFRPSAEINLIEESRGLLSTSGDRIIETKGVRIEATITKTDQNVHYQWFLSPCLGAIGFPFNPNMRYCSVYNNLNKPRIRLLEDRRYNGQAIRYPHELLWLRERITGTGTPGDVPSMIIMEIDEFIISEKAFNYWSNIKASVENIGSIFDASQARITGNVVQLSSGKSALGFFGVYREAPVFRRFELQGYGFVD